MPPTSELTLLGGGLAVTLLAWTFTGPTLFLLTCVGCAMVFAALVLQHRRRRREGW